MSKPAIWLELGRVVVTMGAVETLSTTGTNAVDLLFRHQTGDWGELDSEDERLNDVAALSNIGRILSSYTLTGDCQVWIITESDRSSTCILLPEEY